MDYIARQATLSMGFPRQEYWSGLPFSPLGDLPDPGIKPTSLASLALAGGFFTASARRKESIKNEAGEVKCFCPRHVLENNRGIDKDRSYC